jgi:hypothetical protein
VPGVELSFSLREKKQKQQQIHIGACLVLQGKAGVRDPWPAVEAQ